MKLQNLRQERTKEDTNEQYMKIRSIAKEKVHSTLSNSKVLLKYALLSLVESMKKDPDTFTSLIYNDIYSPSSSTWDYVSQYHASFDIYGLHQQYPSQDYFSDDCVDMLVKEAQKVYNNQAKECIEGSIDEYAASTSSLQLLPSPTDGS